MIATESTQITHDVVTSPDGARIAYTRQGSGPVLILLHCVSCDRVTTPQPGLPDALAEHFTVVTYDRRGNGESTTVEPYAVERELDDLTALIAEVGDEQGGPVDVYGFSSGAVLSLIAAHAGLPIRRLALLEPPLMPGSWATERAELRELMGESREDARTYYLTQVVGVPPEVLETIPATEQDLANAPTMLHELDFLPGTDAERFRGLATPTLLIRSDHTVPEMAQWADELVAVMPHAHAVELPGEWHGVDDTTLSLAVRDFLQDRGD